MNSLHLTRGLLAYFFMNNWIYCMNLTINCKKLGCRTILIIVDTCQRKQNLLTRFAYNVLPSRSAALLQNRPNAAAADTTHTHTHTHIIDYPLVLQSASI